MGYRLSCCTRLCGVTDSAWGVPPDKSYDVFIIPGDGLDTLITQTSAQLAQCGLRSLAAQGFRPHVTLYLADYGPDALPQLKQVVAALSQRWHAFPMCLTQLTQTRGDWLMISVQNSPSLQGLSDSLVHQLSPYRDKAAPVPAWVNAYPEKKAAFAQYGSPNVFADFDPHITLLAQSDHAALSRFMQRYGQYVSGQTVEAIGLGIAETDSNGQSKTLLARYDFAASSAGQ